MIDCGMPFNAMRDELYKCNTLLITHIHTDHIKDSTFRKILSEFPRIKTFSNPTVAYKYHINEGHFQYTLPDSQRDRDNTLYWESRYGGVLLLGPWMGRKYCMQPTPV